MSLPDEHRVEIVTNGLHFVRAITEAYGTETGMALWEQIADVLDPNVKGEIFFAMITGNYNNRILLKGVEEDVNAVWCIKAIRAYTKLGLKEAKDIFDRLRSPFGHTEYITVKPEDYNTAYRELRKVGIRV